MADKILLRRGNKADLPVLNVGEPGFATDTKELFIGASGGNAQVAMAKQPAWSTAALLAVWAANAGIGVQYRKTDTNRLDLRVNITGGTKTAGTIFANIPNKPVTQTPINAVTFDSSAQNSAGILITLTTNGDLRIDSTPGTGGVALQFITLSASIPLD